jgi:hypothetical protein
VFPWGRIERTHRVGPYAIVEAIRERPYGNESDEEFKLEQSFDRTRSFHTYVDGRSTNHSYHSLDHALVACVTWRHEALHRGVNAALNERASGLFMRMIGPGGDDA